MRLKDTPIQTKLMLVILLTSGIVLALTCTAFITYEIITLRRNLVQGYTTRTRLIAANSTAALAFQNDSDATDILGTLKTDSRIIRACIFDDQNQPFASYPPNLPAAAFPQKPITDGYRYTATSLEIFCPVIQDNHRLGTVYVETNLSALTERYHAYFWLAGSIFASSFLVAFLLSRALQKQISGPILALAETARTISSGGDFSVRTRKFGNDELGLLTDAFNQMLDDIHKLNLTLEKRVLERTAQLEAVNKELEAFSYSVSHDLRAPLRHIDGFVDLLRKDSQETISPASRRYLKIVSEAATRMGMLIDDLLVFSRMGRSEMQYTAVNTDELVAEVITDSEHDLKGRAIEWKIQPLPAVRADRPMLKQVLGQSHFECRQV